MPEFWAVKLNGVPVFKGFTTRREAEAKAEKWQGRHGKSGLLKHKDFGDYAEICRDVQAEREWDARYRDFKDGKPQRFVQTGGWQ
jgi:hypothetical protein